MLKTVILLTLFFVLMAPFLTLVHEMGHAVVPLFRGQEVKIKVGSPRIVNFQIGNLTVEIGFLSPWIGFTHWKDSAGVVALAGGPLLSLFLGVALLLSGTKGSVGYTSAFLFAGAGWCLIQFIFTATPIIYPSWLGYEPGTPSDGFKILEMLRSR